METDIDQESEKSAETAWILRDKATIREGGRARECEREGGQTEWANGGWMGCEGRWVNIGG